MGLSTQAQRQSCNCCKAWLMPVCRWLRGKVIKVAGVAETKEGMVVVAGMVATVADMVGGIDMSAADWVEIFAVVVAVIVMSDGGF